MKNLKEHNKMVIFLDEDWHKQSAETLWVISLGNNSYQVDNIPILAKGISYGDIVYSNKKDDGFLIYDKILKKSGNCTYRIIFDEKIRKNEKEFDKYIKKLSKYGEYESGVLNIIGFNIKNKELVYKFYEILEELEEKGILDFEEGDYNI